MRTALLPRRHSASVHVAGQISSSRGREALNAAGIDTPHPDAQARRASVVIHVTGQVASGKSHVREALASALDVPSVGIDDERIKLLAPGEH